MIKLVAKKEDNLVDYLTKFEGLNYNLVQTFLRKKDIRVNGTRVKANLKICKNDEVVIYAKSTDLFNYSVVFEDENIIVVNKPKKLEVVSTTRDIDLIRLLQINVLPVHRLDYNTEGLVIFAKNEDSYNELLTIFKERLVEKKYLCVACGNLLGECFFKNFLVEKNDGRVEISDNFKFGAKEILLKVKPLENIKNFCLLEVELLTGKMHQIRAQLAFNDLPILGDEKYGKGFINKKLGYKNQVLVSNSIKFKLNEKIKFLQYLNNKEIKLKENNIIKIFDKIKSLNA